MFKIHRGYTRLLSLSDSSNLFDDSTNACRHLQQSLFSTLVHLDINTKSIEPRGFISVVSASNHSSSPLYDYLLNHHFHLLRSLHGPDVFSISKLILDEIGVSAEIQYLRNVVGSVHDHIMPEKASPFQNQICRMKENADKIILPCDGLNNESLYSSKILKLCEFITDMLPSKIDSVVCVVGSREIEPFLLMAIQTLLLEASILMELSVLEQPSGLSVIRLKNADSTEFLEMSVVSVSALQMLTFKSSDCIIWFSPSFAFANFSALSSVRTQYMVFVDGVRPEVSDAATSIVDTNLSPMTDIPIYFKSNIRKVFLSPEVTLNLLSKYCRSLFGSSDCDVILEFYLETLKSSIGSVIERQTCIHKSGAEEMSTPSAQCGNQSSTQNLHKSSSQRPFPEKRILKSRKNNDERTISLTSIFTSVLPSTTPSNEHPWYRCILLLPPKFPLSQTEFVGQWCLDSQSAKEDVTFQACVDLCRKVQLSSRNKMYTLLAAPPLRCKRPASDIFPLYITGFVSQKKDTSCFQNVAVLTKLPIPFDVIPRVVVIPDDIPRSFEITPFPAFPLCLNKEKMELLTKFHQEIANRGFNLNLTKEEKTEMPDLFILAPILESVSNIKIPTNDTIDWEMVEAFCNIQDGWGSAGTHSSRCHDFNRSIIPRSCFNHNERDARKFNQRERQCTNSKYQFKK
ncbi:hypothetical protein BKA69DRAFT_760953 [Paraphysoderma sedebokerense]|nr:hypothetical protein BKA69DRAFT_760953 [Paraphysoderma sedebokerense]